MKEMMQAIEAREIIYALRDLQEAHWKTVRRMLIALDQGVGHQALGYESFKAFVAGEFEGRDHNYFCSERMSGRIELSLRIEVATYPTYTLRPLRQFRAIKEDYRQAIDKSEQLLLMKQCWGIARENADQAGRQMPNADDIINAKLRMHKEQPDLVKYPSAKNGVQVWKCKYEQAQSEVEELKAKRAFLAVEAAKSLAEIQTLKATQHLVQSETTDSKAYMANREMQRQMDAMQHEITLLRNGNNLLLAKNKELLQANQNLANRQRLGINR